MAVARLVGADQLHYRLLEFLHCKCWYFYVAVRNILRVESRDGSWLGRRLLVSVIEADLQSYGNDRGEAWGLNAKGQGASERERRSLTKDWRVC
jgi:hypothetical protein